MKLTSLFTTILFALGTVSNATYSEHQNSDKSDSKRAPPTSLQIGVKYRPKDCPIKAGMDDKVAVHYEGTLFDNGEKFDSSYDRGKPIEFFLGQGQVIKGWDQGILGMCIGEKRILKIPSDLAYGKSGAPPAIPPNAALVFRTELVAVNGKGAENAENAENEDRDEL